ncbi:MAG TPA: RtcB family protein [Bacillota bacterium]|nr:RtcB family protein [Bacillota bacterium]
MFVIYQQENQRVPVKVWLKEQSELEPECQGQAMHLANLPFAFKHVALMPDTHTGYGMPIGGVLATDGVIIPNAVGVDIGCGMGFVHTNIPASILKTVDTSSGKLARQITGAIMREVPVGFAHHKEAQACAALDLFQPEHLDDQITAELLEEIEAGYYQVGTLGGGNHFIELQEDEAGHLSIMLHSGSRNFGYKICRYFNQRAKELNRDWFASVLPQWDLAFLPVDSPAGQAYIEWMNLALDFAKENRQLMMERVKNLVFNCVKKYAGITGIEVDLEVNAHHNYAAIENHFGRNVWVHRKGAIRAREEEWGIIPGAMGSYSYIVKGLGNPESFQSCSHGAGRKMGRKEAERQFRYEDVLEDLQRQEITLGTPNRSKITDECRWAYKEIDQVIANESDLVEPVMKVKTVAVIKAS